MLFGHGTFNHPNEYRNPMHRPSVKYPYYFRKFGKKFQIYQQNGCLDLVRWLCTTRQDYVECHQVVKSRLITTICKTKRIMQITML